MTDEEAIELARKYGIMIVKIPPMGCIDEVTTVNLLVPCCPVVTREPSSNYCPISVGS